MPSPETLFHKTPENITDFSKVSAGQIFNSSILEDFNAILSEGDAVRNQELERNTAEDLYSSQNDDAFLSQVLSKRSAPMVEPMMDYNAPIGEAVVTPSQSQTGGFKLSNYGYDSDSSPDYNSNVRRVGHANNKLEDGVSAALTKSLARKYGLKTGDYFEAVTADGKVLKRRYDDTVPTTYRGRALPETVDLYERSGKNSFAGKVLEIRPLKT